MPSSREETRVRWEREAGLQRVAPDVLPAGPVERRAGSGPQAEELVQTGAARATHSQARTVLHDHDAIAVEVRL